MANDSDARRDDEDDERLGEISRVVTLLGTVAHDIRSPLQSAVVSTGLLAREPLSDRAKKHLAVLRRSHDRMRWLVQDLLDFAEYTKLGRLVLRRKPCDLAPLVTSVVEDLRTAYSDRTITLQITSDATGEWDALRVGQLLTNLVANAVNHGDPNQPIAVELIAEPGFSDAVIRVGNQGPPIPQTLLPLLFDPFKRGGSPTESHGVGLGLAIVRQIALSHGGAVDVDSSSDGTFFTVVLPRQ